MTQAAVSGDALRILRRSILAIWLVKLIPEPITLWSDLPFAILRPVGVTALMPTWLLEALLSNAGMLSLKAALLLSLTWSVVRRNPSVLVLGTAAVLLLVHQSLVRGFSLVNHQEIAALLCVWILVLFPRLELKTTTGPASPIVEADRRIAVSTMTLMLLLPYSLLGINRMIHGAPEVFLDGSMRFWLANSAAIDPGGWYLGTWALGSPAVAGAVTAAFPILTCVEVVSPLCMLSRVVRTLWLCLMVPFHVLTSVLMNIFFWENIVLATLLLTNGRAVALLETVEEVAARRFRRYVKGTSRLSLG